MIKKILNSAIQGLFWILPITAIVFITLWLFEKVNLLINYLFALLGFDPDKYQELWLIAGVLLMIVILAIIGFIATTRLAAVLENIVKKIPLYSTIKDLISIFNSSKDDNHNVLVVAVNGFATKGYNIALMYSTKESIIPEHYTVTTFLSPLPSSGFMFEIHKDDILVIEGAKFNDNLQYLLSMGTKSLTDIVKNDNQKLTKLTDYLKNATNNN